MSEGRSCSDVLDRPSLELAVATRLRDVETAEALRERNRGLREALHVCRQQLKRTQELLERAPSRSTGQRLNKGPAPGSGQGAGRLGSGPNLPWLRFFRFRRVADGSHDPQRRRHSVEIGFHLVARAGA
jgi:hypothetical protein